MTREPISDLIARGEGPTVEFKRSLTKDVGRVLCAFANAGGGTILIGVSDTGETVGVADHNRLKSRVQSTARSLDPPIELEVESVGRVLRVVVPPQKRKPYSFGGLFFMRIGANSQQMSNAEVEDLFYAVGRLHFDGKPCANFSIENDLDEETLGAVLRPRQGSGSDGSDGGSPEPPSPGRGGPHDPRRRLAPGPRHSQVHHDRTRVLRSVHGHRESENSRSTGFPSRHSDDDRRRGGVDAYQDQRRVHHQARATGGTAGVAGRSTSGSRCECRDTS